MKTIHHLSFGSNLSYGRVKIKYELSVSTSRLDKFIRQFEKDTRTKLLWDDVEYLEPYIPIMDI